MFTSACGYSACVCVCAAPRAVCVGRMRHFPRLLHNLPTLAPGSCSGPGSRTRLRINGASERALYLPRPPRSERERRGTCVFTSPCPVYEADISSAHKTCFLYSLPSVNNAEGVNTIKGPARPLSVTTCQRAANAAG